MISTKNMIWVAAACLTLLVAACQSEEESRGTTVSFTSVSPTHKAPIHRTKMNNLGAFSWTAGDYIFVKNGANYVRSNNAASSIKNNETFYFEGMYDDQYYDVLYTGNGPDASPNSVTIKANQIQMKPSNAEHFATSGDCGKARASRDASGNYTFNLEHMASYLNIELDQPEPPTAEEGLFINRVTVQTSGADNLCGTYTFSENTLNLRDETNSDPGKMVSIRLTRKIGFELPYTNKIKTGEASLADARTYVVIQPGVHTLTFTFYDDEVGLSYVKTVPQREFLPGHITPIHFTLSN